MLCIGSTGGHATSALRRSSAGWGTWRRWLRSFAFAPLVLAGVAAHAQQILLVSPSLPTSADEITIFLSVVHCSFRVTSAVQGSTVYLYPDTSSPCPPLAPPNPGLETSTKLGPLPAGSYTVVVVTNGKTTDSRALLVQAPVAHLALLDGRFAVSATFSFPQGTAAVGAEAVQLGDASGYFWFFDKDAVELTVKMVNGVLINTQYWVFISSATDVPFTVTIADTWVCSSPPLPRCPAVRTYQGPVGANVNFIDLTAFSPP
jgi:hypothetical protein